MRKMKARRILVFFMCLTVIVGLFPAPIHRARAAMTEGEQTYTITCASQEVGKARLRREGAALILSAEIDADSSAYMTHVRVGTGETTIADVPLSAAESRAFTRAYYGIDPSAAAFALDIDLAMPGSGEQQIDIVSGKNVPDAVVVEKNSANENPDHAWNRLVYEPEGQKLGTETFGAADAGGLVNKVLKGTGAQWVYPAADSTTLTHGGSYTARMQGKIHIAENRIVKRAVLMIAADDGYALRINGTLLPLPASSSMIVGADDTPMEKIVLPSLPNTSASFPFQHVAVYDLVKENVDLQSGDNPYTLNVYSQGEISGVIFALRIVTAPLLTETFHQSATLPATAGAVRASFAILKVGDNAVSGPPSVAPGDRLVVGITLKNESAIPLRPGALIVTLPIGLRAGTGERYRIADGARIAYPASETALGPGMTAALELAVTVDANALGSLDLKASMPIVLSDAGEPLPNAAGSAEWALTVTKAAAANDIQITNILGRASGFACPLPATPSAALSIRSGDRLDFELRLENNSDQPITPERIEVTPAQGLYAVQADLPQGWSLSGTQLVHTSMTIPAGQSIRMPYTLRVATGASGSTAVSAQAYLAQGQAVTTSADYAIHPGRAQVSAAHRVVSVENGTGAASGALRVNGRIRLSTTIENTGTMPIHPRSVAFAIPDGLEAWQDDNPLHLWRVEGNRLILQEAAMGLLLPGETASFLYTLRASAYMEGTKKQIPVEVGEMVNGNGDVVSSRQSVSVVEFAVSGTTPEYKLSVTGNLQRVDDQAITSGMRILPGARLSMTLNLKNQGNRPVIPKDFEIMLPNGLYVDPRDNSAPMWTVNGAALVYSHGSAFIEPGASVKREFTLRVSEDAQPGNLTPMANISMLSGPFGEKSNPTTYAKANFASIPVAALPECAIAVTQSLHRINDAEYGAENHVLRTGDTVSIQVAMENRGSREARLEAVTITPPFGLQVIEDMLGARWSYEEDKLIYTPDASEIIASGQKKTATYYLRVGVTASGSLEIPCAAAQAIDNAGLRQQNPIAAAAARLYVDGVTATYKLQAEHKLVRINGNAVTQEMKPRPGDLLTFELRLENQGNQPVYPKPLGIAITEGFTIEGEVDSPWTADKRSLTYTYAESRPIPAGETRTAAYSLRLGLAATGTQRVESAAPSLENGDRKAVGNAATAARLDIEVGPALAAALGITHKLVKVNGEAVTGAYSARPGDDLVLEMTLKNDGRMALYPETIAVRYAQGLYAQAGDNAAPWTLMEGALQLNLARKRIDPGSSESVQYVLHVRDDAQGDQWVETKLPKVVDDRGCEVENEKAESRETIVLLPPLSVSLVVSNRVAYINDQEVSASYTVRPGDKLTFEMSIKNAGQKAVKPKGLVLTWSEGLYLQESDNENPPWAKGADGLDYVHEGATIAVGAVQKRTFSLRVRGDGQGEQRVSATLAQVIDAIGGTLANETPEALARLTVSDTLIPSLKITHRLSRINGVSVGSVYTIHPGDKLTFTMVMENNGNMPVRPDAVKVNHTSGLTATQNANSNPPWSLREGALLYTHEGGTIPAGGVRSVEYGLTVNANGKGQQRVDSSVPDIMDAQDKWVTNCAADAKLEFMVVADTGYALLVTHRLSKINDIAVGTSYSVNPGDKLTFSMSIANVGSKPAKPDTIAVSRTSGLSVVASDNGNAWRTQGDVLVYTHSGTVLGVSETHIVEYVMRVVESAAGTSQTISSSAAEILDQAGGKVANEQPKSTLQFSIAGARGETPSQSGTGYLGLRLIKVNEKAAEGIAAISDGDRLTFALGITNRAKVSARPGEIVVVLPSGMMLEERENAGTGWTVAGNTLRYAWQGGVIAAGETRSVEFTAHVRSGAAGDQTVTAETASFYDAGNKLVEGSGNQKASLTVRVGNGLTITTKFWLSTVNGKGTGLTGEEETHPPVKMVPGDALGYTIRATNRGGQSAAPSEYTVAIPDNHEFDAKKNPGWSIVNGLLVYHYSGAMLGPGAHADVELKLTLKKGANRGQGTFTFTYDLTQVWTHDGNTADYDGHGQTVVPVQVGDFGSLARTGEGTGVLVMLALGAALLGAGGAMVFRARRRKVS